MFPDENGKSQRKINSSSSFLAMPVNQAKFTNEILLE
jgi:hypothetical protein